ncbi:4-alpha-glucanotransferase [Treponema phagedenis]|uniref:4-alpha-glucanotransferase n=1 Tax=Treponema phagedenis TaxID=162 RepID=UPI0004665357|nr:4-alpha-glucanotransferase [Treponema phagedenis]
MKLFQDNKSLYGVVVPVSALRSKKSLGVGEFLDLIPFADFCKKASLKIIQLLPVNDSGTDKSPYSILSAVALHPLYLCLQIMPGAKKFEKEIKKMQAEENKKNRFDYEKILHEKVVLLHAMFNVEEESIIEDAKNGELAEWIQKNTWIKEYAVFRNLKRQNFNASWKTWTYMRSPIQTEIMNAWNDSELWHEHLFYAWIQMHLHKQLLEAALHCEKIGIVLKGDIPIMMNEDSVDVWANPELFRMDLRAGNPPDGDNPDGQNWGFPIYNWENLKETNYAWWKTRLILASHYYAAYRLDHILGFFRIWAIPEGECTGFLGWTIPYEEILSRELLELGFTKERIRWMSEPHVPTQAIEAVNNNDYLYTHGLLHKLMDRIGDEELWLFKPQIKTESDIYAENLPFAVQTELCKRFRDRIFITIGRDTKARPVFMPSWNYKNTTAWGSLSDTEKEELKKLFDKKQNIQDELWRKQANEILGQLCQSVEMQACAEDLGAIPACVPETLEKLGIYSLKVFRWERKWEEAQTPFIPLQNYIPMSVATTSVHDSSTLRGWWEEEASPSDILSFVKAIGFSDSECITLNFANQGADGLLPAEQVCPYSEEVAEKILQALCKVPSKLIIFPIQDWLALIRDKTGGVAASDERINIPGTVNSFNWSYRLPLFCEDLIRESSLIEKIKQLIQNC